MNQLFKFLSSLRLTVWLLGISVLLVFLGSISQVPEGLWSAQVRWFKSWLVFRREGDEWYVPPVFPGGHLLGAFLLVNLLAAHFKRFTWNFQKFGIQLTHFGIVVMLIGQLITDETAVESFISFKEGETKRYTESHRDSELVFFTEAPGDQYENISFPQGLVAKQGTLSHPKLPFTVKVHGFGENGDILTLSQVPPSADRLKRALATVEGRYTSVDGLVAAAEADAPNPGRYVVWRKTLRGMGIGNADIVAAVTEVSKDAPRASKLLESIKLSFREEMLTAFKNSGGEMGYVAMLAEKNQLETATDTKASTTQGTGALARVVPLPPITDDRKGRSIPWAIIEIFTEGGKKSTGTWLVSSMLKPQVIEAEGKSFQFAMRFERYYTPFSLTLLRAKQEVYQGTSQAKEYASQVRIQNPETKEDRPADITMNNPLRYGGLTFYQSTMNQMGRGPGVAAMLEAFTGRPKEEFMDREEQAGDRESGLQVVENPSMLAPYTGCILVGFGMLWQFLLHLTGFLAKRAGMPSPSYGVAHPLLPVCAALIVIPDIFLAIVAFREGTLFAIAVLAATPLIRVVLAWQVWKGRYHIFTLVFLLVATMLMLIFAIKYNETYGNLLWPIVVCQLAAFVGIAIALFSGNQKSAPLPA